MKKSTPLLLIIIILGISSLGNSVICQDIHKGVEFYHQEKYSAALDAFNDIIKNGDESAILYYNIGNVHSMTKDNAHAIWAYEKALKLNPHLEEAKVNLLQLNKEIDNDIIHIKTFFLLKWWDNIIKLFLPNIWAILSILTLILWISLICIRWFANYPVTSKQIFSSLFIWLVILCISIGSYVDYKDHSEAIIMQEDIFLHIGADERSDKTIELPAGLKINILDQIDDWLKIRLPDLSEGWVHQDVVGRI